MSYSSEVLADSPGIWPRLNSATPITVSAATASSYYFADPPPNAFDGDPSTPWTTNGVSSGWLRAQLSTATVLTDYILTSRAGFTTRAPNTWTFEGSNDGSSWTTLDTRSGVTWSSGETKAYSFSNSTAYLYYRLNVSANNGDTYLDLCEMSFPYSPDSSGNNRYLVSPAGTAPTIASNGPVQANSMEWGALSGFVRSLYETTAPTVGTFECWVKFASNPAADLTLLSWSPNSGGNGSTLYLQLLTNGKIRLGIYNGSTVNADSTSALSTGTWHHVIGSIGAAGMKVRVDKTNTGSNTPTGANSPGATAFRIHGRYNGSSGVEQTAAVQVAEAAFYATQLTDTRTDAHYDAAAAVTGTLAITLPVPTVAFSGTYTPPANPTGSLAVDLPMPVVEFAGTYTPPLITGSFDIVLPLPLVEFNGLASSALGSFAITLPVPQVRFFADYLGPYPTDTSNVLDGRERGGSAVVLTSVAVEPLPATLVLAGKVDKAAAYPTPTMDDGRPT